MRWLYITLGIVGGLVPAIYLYARTYTNAENNVGFLDLGLFFLGLGLSFMAMPLGIAGGLLVAGLVHLSLNLLQRRRRPPVTLWSRADTQSGVRHSWVTQGSTTRPGRKPDA